MRSKTTKLQIKRKGNLPFCVVLYSRENCKAEKERDKYKQGLTVSFSK